MKTMMEMSDCSYEPYDDGQGMPSKMPLKSPRRAVLPMVEADLRGRVEIGTKEYGEPLTSHNGRDPLWDAYEEALDLAMYLRQAIWEQKGY
jgi:hypothetical protein